MISFLFLHINNIYFLYFPTSHHVFHPSFYTVVIRVIIKCKMITMIKISSTTMIRDRTSFTSELVKIYCIHFRKWSKIGRSTFMIFYQKTIMLFNNKTCKINSKYFLNSISRYYYYRNSILEAWKMENIFSDILWSVIFCPHSFNFEIILNMTESYLVIFLKSCNLK